MAAASRVLATSLGPDGLTATLSVNYDDVTLVIANVTLDNQSSADCIVHIVNRGGATKLDQTEPTGTTTFDLSGLGERLTQDLTFRSGWEIGLGF